MQLHRDLATMLRGQQAALTACKPVETSVECEADPKVPGRTAIRISGATREAVQAEINFFTRAADANGAPPMFLRFIGPARVENGWGALGEIIVRQPETVG